MNEPTWNPLGDIDEQAEENNKIIQEQENELNKLFVRVLNTEDGKKFLEYHTKNTVDKPTFFPQMGLDNGAAMGFYRDGQNSIVREMTIRLKKGLEIQ